MMALFKSIKNLLLYQKPKNAKRFELLEDDFESIDREPESESCNQNDI